MTTPTEAVINVLNDYFNFVDLLATNLYSAPHDLTDGVYNASFVITTLTSSVSAPDGTTPVSAPRETSATTNGYVLQDTTVEDNTETHRPFVYLKQGDTNTSRLETTIIGGGFVSPLHLQVDWTTSPPSIDSQSDSESTLEAVGNDWYKITVPITKPGTGGTTLRTTLYPAGKTVITDIGTVYAWGFTAFDDQPKIYNIVSPGKAAAPFAVVQKVAQTRVNTMSDSGGQGVENGRFRITIYAKTISEAETLSEQARLALMAAVTLKASPLMNIDDFDDGTKLYQVIVDYSIWYRH